MIGDAHIMRQETATKADPVLPISRADGFFEFDRAQAKRIGEGLADAYRNADPFAHIALDNFIDAEVLREVDRQFPRPEKGRFDDAYSHLKTGYVLDKIRSPYIQDLLSALNSAAFLNFLEKMTGIKGLVSDPRFTGGGLHETRRGGHLSVHADFNFHPVTKLRRRINLILFLNEGWNADWGGGLELWDKGMTHAVKTVMPELGRAVIFNTDSDSYHGHPDPLQAPEDVTRRSIALYYYTAPDGFRVPHTTKWRKRPGSADQVPPVTDRVRHVLKHYFGKGEDG
tara:strand:+ start:1563 stop:2414 length:852 start_codon:yes stop_codon:yes gene_type:complete